MTDTELLDFYESIAPPGTRYQFVNTPCGIVTASRGCHHSLSYPSIRSAMEAHRKYNEEHGVGPTTLGIIDP